MTRRCLRRSELTPAASRELRRQTHPPHRGQRSPTASDTTLYVTVTLKPTTHLQVFFRKRWAVIGQLENVRRYWPEFHGRCIVSSNWKWEFSFKITTNIIVVVVKLNLHVQYSSAQQTTPLLTCNFRVSTFNCVIWDIQISHLCKISSFARNFQVCHKL